MRGVEVPSLTANPWWAKNFPQYLTKHLHHSCLWMLPPSKMAPSKCNDGILTTIFIALFCSLPCCFYFHRLVASKALALATPTLTACTWSGHRSFGWILHTANKPRNSCFELRAMMGWQQRVFPPFDRSGRCRAKMV